MSTKIEHGSPEEAFAADKQRELLMEIAEHIGLAAEIQNELETVLRECADIPTKQAIGRVFEELAAGSANLVNRFAGDVKRGLLEEINVSYWQKLLNDINHYRLQEQGTERRGKQ